MHKSAAASVRLMAHFPIGPVGTVDLAHRSVSKYVSSIPNIKLFVKRMAEEFGETFSKPTAHPYGEKTMSFQGDIFSYPSAYKQLWEMHLPIFLDTKGTGKVSTNNGKVRTDDDRHHNSLKGVWNRIVRPVPPLDKDLKRDKNAERQLKRVLDRSEYADAGAADRIAVERANKNQIWIQLLLVAVCNLRLLKLARY
jgi:hypothetical protein